MHKTMIRQGNGALIAGILVVLIIVGSFKLLWMAIHAPFVWVVLVAWLVLPILPFALRLLTLRLEPTKRNMDGLC